MTPEQNAKSAFRVYIYARNALFEFFLQVSHAMVTKKIFGPMSHVMWDVHWTGLRYAAKKFIDRLIGFFQNRKLHKTFL